MNPEIPASASWTIEIWPTKPVITTTDRHMIVARSDVISACRKSYGKTISATTAAVVAEQRRRPEALRTRGERQPLLDELAAARQARAADEHRDHHQPEDEERLDSRHRDAVVGREPALDLEVVEDVLEHPDPEPDEAGDPERREAREERRGQRRHDLRAAARCGSSCVIEAARTPSPPATNVASSVLARASWLGESPISIAPISFSEAARVASPNRLQPVDEREHERGGEDDRRQDEPVDRDVRAEDA